MNDLQQNNSATETVCIVCPNGCRVRCESIEGSLVCTGQACKRGEAYALAERTRPMRTLTTSVRTVFSDAPVVSVRTSGEIEKGRLRDAMEALREVVVDRRVSIGEIVAANICNTGVNIICTSNRLVNHA